MRAGRFREDLYYRVRVLEIAIPPLRERPEDILWLAGRYLAEQARRFPEELRVLTATDRERLLAHPWPGNVRELKHRLERACILAQGERLALALDEGVDDPTAAPPIGGQTGDGQPIGGQPIEDLRAQAAASEREAITAAQLGISRKTLWQKMKRLGIRRP